MSNWHVLSVDGNAVSPGSVKILASCVIVLLINELIDCWNTESVALVTCSKFPGWKDQLCISCVCLVSGTSPWWEKWDTLWRVGCWRKCRCVWQETKVIICIVILFTMGTCSLKTSTNKHGEQLWPLLNAENLAVVLVCKIGRQLKIRT